MQRFSLIRRCRLEAISFPSDSRCEILGFLEEEAFGVKAEDVLDFWKEEEDEG